MSGDMFKNFLNTLIIGSIVLILYSIIGHRYVQFYFAGKTEMLEWAAQFNELCNTNRSCPTSIDGWQVLDGPRESLRKNNLQYYLSPDEEIKDSGSGKKILEFTLVYGFFMPDHWFESQGGVDREVTSNWKNR